MAKYKHSTLGELMEPVAAPAQEQPIVEPAAAEPISAPVTTEPAAQAAPTAEPTKVVEPANAEPVKPAQGELAAAQAANESVFEIPGQPAPAAQAAAQPTERTWQEIVKGIDRKELLKELDLPELDDFTKNFIKFREQGGDPYQYLAAKSFDWTKASDIDVLKDDLRREYPTLSPDKIEALFNDKYRQGEFNTDEEKASGAILMEADAYKKRNARIAEQQSFKIPEVAKQEAALAPEIQQQLAAIQEYGQRQQQLQSYVKENAVTKSLFEGKKVSVDMGDGNVYNFKVDNPQLLQDVLLDNDTAAKYGVNAQGEPDMQLAYELAMFKINPAGFKKALLNYGKSLGQQALIAEGQNPGKQATVVPMNTGNKMVIKGEGTIGG